MLGRFSIYPLNRQQTPEQESQIDNNIIFLVSFHKKNNKEFFFHRFSLFFFCFFFDLTRKNNLSRLLGLDSFFCRFKKGILRVTMKCQASK